MSEGHGRFPDMTVHWWLRLVALGWALVDLGALGAGKRTTLWRPHLCLCPCGERPACSRLGVGTEQAALTRSRPAPSGPTGRAGYATDTLFLLEKAGMSVEKSPLLSVSLHCSRVSQRQRCYLTLPSACT